MYLTESCFVLMAWVASSALGGYTWIESNGHLELYRQTGSIPVVRPSGIARPNQFRNPSTTKRPFRRRPSTKPQAFPFVVPSMPTRPLLMMSTTPPPSVNGPSQEMENLGLLAPGEPPPSSPGNFQDSSPEINGEVVSDIVQERPPGTIDRPAVEPMLPVPSQPNFTPQPENIVTIPQPTTAKPVIPYLPQTPLVFPVVRPPAFTMSRPLPKPPAAPLANEPQLNPNAQPPFDSGPYVPPKPPPVPMTSNFGVRPAPIGSKPQRPLPPFRPILQKPPPLPLPSFQLTTTEKPELIYSDSSMPNEGNYNFDFLVSNSVYRREQGFLKKSLVKPWGLIPVKTGAYSFISPEGTSHRTDFVADENGYRAFQSSS